MPHEKYTYLPYSRGIDPTRLRLGSLVLDPYNPATGLETNRCKYRARQVVSVRRLTTFTDSEYRSSQEDYWKAIEPWAGDAQLDSPCALEFEASHDWAVGAKVAGAFHGDWEKQASNHVTIEGVSGRRFEIEEPLRFFSEEVFSHPDAKSWIQKQASISLANRVKNRLKHRNEHWKSPDMWVCTGIQLITGGRAVAGVSKKALTGISATVDPGMAHGVPTGQSAVSMNGSHQASSSSTNQYQHKDERIWAAQFHQINVEFTKSEAGRKDDLLVDLRQIEDLGAGAVRAGWSSDDDSEDERVSMPGVARIIGFVDIQAGNTQRKQSENVHDIEISTNTYSEQMNDIDWKLYEEHSKYWERLVQYDRR